MFEISSSIAWDLFQIINLVILLYFFAINLSYFILVVVSFIHIRRQYNTLNVHDFSGVFSSNLFKSYSIIVPVYNEEDDIEEAVHSMLQQQYGEYEVIIVNDGSTDKTLTYLKEKFDLYSSKRHISSDINHEPIRDVYASSSYANLFVVDKENGQKADAINAGINASRKDLFCAVDGDSILERDVLLKMLSSFARDKETIAVGGIIRVTNGCTFERGELNKISTPSGFIELIQVVEYIRSFIFGRTGWEFFNGLILISGAFGVFDREAVIKVGGYDADAIGEDFELTVKLHKYHKDHQIPHRITFQPEPVCWTKVPDNWATLSSQRNRWQRGLMQTLWRHRRMMFNPRYGFVGLVSMPFYFFFELLGPVIELFGYILISYLLLTGNLSVETSLLFFIIALLFGWMLTVTSLLCDELTYGKYPDATDLLKLGIVSIFESFGYRQLHAWWRVKGMVTYLQGKMKWSMVGKKPDLINFTHWIWFILINAIIIYLFYYGLSGGLPL